MSLKEKLKNNRLTIGSWLTIGHSSIAEIMAMNNFEWITIDMEHSAIDFSDALNLIAHIQSFGKKALVRVSKNEEVAIKRVMDAGADGVIIPMVKSGSDAKRAVEFVKYPPKGKRGIGLARAQKYGSGFEQYKEWLNNNVVIIAQIEHIDAVHSINEIINTEGIDGTIIGPYDLSGSMGFPGEFDQPEVKNAILKIENACKQNNRPLGIHVIEPDIKKIKEFIRKGYTFIAFSVDFLWISRNIEEKLALLSNSAI